MGMNKSSLGRKNTNLLLGVKQKNKEENKSGQVTWRVNIKTQQNTGPRATETNKQNTVNNKDTHIRTPFKAVKRLQISEVCNKTSLHYNL